MTIPLPIAARLPHEPTPVALPSEGRLPSTYETLPLDEDRWKAWQTKGRLADGAFAEQMRSVALIAAVVACAVGIYWIGFD
jgi:hypothetical protein